MKGLWSILSLRVGLGIRFQGIGIRVQGVRIRD